MRDVGSLRHFRFDPRSFLKTLYRHGIEVGVNRQIYRAFPQFAFSGAVVRNYPDCKTLDARSPFEVFIEGRKDHLLILRVAIEFERAGPDRALGLLTGSPLGNYSNRHNGVCKTGTRVFAMERDFERVGRICLDRYAVSLQVGTFGGLEPGGQHGVERVFDVSGGKGLPVVKLDVGAQVERESLVVGR